MVAAVDDSLNLDNGSKVTNWMKLERFVLGDISSLLVVIDTYRQAHVIG